MHGGGLQFQAPPFDCDKLLDEVAALRTGAYHQLLEDGGLASHDLYSYVRQLRDEHGWTPPEGWDGTAPRFKDPTGWAGE